MQSYNKTAAADSALLHIGVWMIVLFYFYKKHVVIVSMITTLLRGLCHFYKIDDRYITDLPFLILVNVNMHF